MDRIITISVIPIAKVFNLPATGFLMASKHGNILTVHGRALQNKLVFKLLLPCVIFSQLEQAITLEKMKEWGLIPVNVLLGSTTGSLIGFIVAAFVRPLHPFFKFTVVHIGIGNLGNLPLVLLSALYRDKFNPFGDSNACSTSGTAYISFGQSIDAITMYTYVLHMLAPPSELGSFDAEDNKLSLPIKNHPKKCTSSLELVKQIFQLPIVESRFTFD